jgi:hypothetical protein
MDIVDTQLVICNEHFSQSLASFLASLAQSEFHFKEFEDSHPFCQIVCRRAFENVSFDLDHTTLDGNMSSLLIHKLWEFTVCHSLSVKDQQYVIRMLNTFFSKLYSQVSRRIPNSEVFVSYLLDLSIYGWVPSSVSTMMDVLGVLEQVLPCSEAEIEPYSTDMLHLIQILFDITCGVLIPRLLSSGCLSSSEIDKLQERVQCHKMTNFHWEAFDNNLRLLWNNQNFGLTDAFSHFCDKLFALAIPNVKKSFANQQPFESEQGLNHFLTDLAIFCCEPDMFLHALKCISGITKGQVHDSKQSTWSLSASVDIPTPGNHDFYTSTFEETFIRFSRGLILSKTERRQSNQSLNSSSGGIDVNIPKMVAYHLIQLHPFLMNAFWKRGTTLYQRKIILKIVSRLLQNGHCVDLVDPELRLVLYVVDCVDTRKDNYHLAPLYGPCVYFLLSVAKSSPGVITNLNTEQVVILAENLVRRKGVPDWDLEYNQARMDIVVSLLRFFHHCGLSRDAEIILYDKIIKMALKFICSIKVRSHLIQSLYFLRHDSSRCGVISTMVLNALKKGILCDDNNCFAISNDADYFSLRSLIDSLTADNVETALSLTQTLCVFLLSNTPDALPMDFSLQEKCTRFFFHTVLLMRFICRVSEDCFAGLARQVLGSVDAEKKSTNSERTMLIFCTSMVQSYIKIISQFTCSDIQERILSERNFCEFLLLMTFLFQGMYQKCCSYAYMVG